MTLFQVNFQIGKIAFFFPGTSKFHEIVMHPKASRTKTVFFKAHGRVCRSSTQFRLSISTKTITLRNFVL